MGCLEIRFWMRVGRFYCLPKDQITLSLLLYLVCLSFLTSCHSYPTSLSSPIWLADLNCSASDDEMNLRACSQSPTGENGCIHSQDIILSCLAGVYINSKTNKRSSKRGQISP